MSFQSALRFFSLVADSSIIRTEEREREVKGVYTDDILVILFSAFCVVGLHILVLMNHRTELLWNASAMALLHRCFR